MGLPQIVGGDPLGGEQSFERGLLGLEGVQFGQNGVEFPTFGEGKALFPGTRGRRRFGAGFSPGFPCQPPRFKFGPPLQVGTIEGRRPARTVHHDEEGGYPVEEGAIVRNGYDAAQETF